MKLHGSLLDNLGAALRSARRLKGHPVHKDTLQFWSDLMAMAREEKRKAPEGDWAETDRLVVAIELELSERSGE